MLNEEQMWRRLARQFASGRQRESCICWSIAAMLSENEIDGFTCNSADRRTENNRPFSDDFENAPYYWPRVELGQPDKNRARFCRRMADLCASEQENRRMPRNEKALR